jgi:hypothetical protein
MTPDTILMVYLLISLIIGIIFIVYNAGLENWIILFLIYLILVFVISIILHNIQNWNWKLFLAIIMIVIQFILILWTSINIRANLYYKGMLKEFEQTGY